ncbi:MAG: cob(I)yrinic acid a,c-diamide adenosyltransferase, partial [Actinobacteria bacterium]|nr:cob(I)yrinic acid a,c-diamide adenosyltransferase [Actinomycetota bacterium]
IRPKNASIILTGSNAPQELIDIADTVTEMKEIKHAFRKGVIAKKGIEY